MSDLDAPIDMSDPTALAKKLQAALRDTTAKQGVWLKSYGNWSIARTVVSGALSVIHIMIAIIMGSIELSATSYKFIGMGVSICTTIIILVVQYLGAFEKKANSLEARYGTARTLATQLMAKPNTRIADVVQLLTVLQELDRDEALSTAQVLSSVTIDSASSSATLSSMLPPNTPGRPASGSLLAAAKSAAAGAAGTTVPTVAMGAMNGLVMGANAANSALASATAPVIAAANAATKNVATAATGAINELTSAVANATAALTPPPVTIVVPAGATTTTVTPPNH